MLQDIAPHTFDNGYSLREPAPDDFAICYRENEVLLAGDGDDVRVPVWSDVKSLAEPFGAASDEPPVYLFSVDGRGYFFIQGTFDEADDLRYRPVSQMRQLFPDWTSFAVLTSLHLSQWYSAHRFCGRCGARMQRSPIERAMACPQCGLIEYPRISPAVIIGIIDGDRLLLTRYSHMTSAHYALVAGYVEIGETLEVAARREVGEEVGLKIGDLRYFASQPWAYSGSLLVGFFADLEGGSEVHLNNDGVDELAEARWVARDGIPATEHPSTLTATMIEAFRVGETG